MDGSLASIFMEGCLPSLPLSWATSGESMEELQQQLICTSMELQSARESAKAQSKLNEEKLCHLHGLLEVTRKERDEARLKCGQLRECLLHLSRNSSQASTPASAAAEPSCSFLQSSISSTSSSAQFSQPSPSSPTIEAALRFQEPPKTCADDGISFFEPNMDLEAFSEKGQTVQDICGLDAATEEGTQQQIFSTSMDILTKDKLAMDNLAPPTFECGSSCVSVSAGSPLISAHVQYSLFRKQRMRGNGSASSSRWNVGNAALACQMSCDISSPGLHRSSQASAAGSPTVLPADPSKVSHDHSKKQSKPETASSKASILELLSKPCHHREPSEGELNAMQIMLPEKGKLLEAVVQAGPLLQNLLLAGALPQWRYPPPQLNTMEISNVPIAPLANRALQYTSPSLSTIDSNGSFIMQSSVVGYTVPCPPAKFSNHTGVIVGPRYVNREKCDYKPLCKSDEMSIIVK